jgi:hypothetical protein
LCSRLWIHFLALRVDQFFKREISCYNEFFLIEHDSNFFRESLQIQQFFTHIRFYSAIYSQFSFLKNLFRTCSSVQFLTFSFHSLGERAQTLNASCWTLQWLKNAMNATRLHSGSFVPFFIHYSSSHSLTHGYDGDVTFFHYSLSYMLSQQNSLINVLKWKRMEKSIQTHIIGQKDSWMCVQKLIASSLYVI